MSVKKDVEFSERQPSYKYYLIGNGLADIFILKNERIVERRDDDTSDPYNVYLYDMNEFRANAEEITEELIQDDPLNWFDYDPSIPNITLEERVTVVEDVIEVLLGGVE